MFILQLTFTLYKIVDTFVYQFQLFIKCTCTLNGNNGDVRLSVCTITQERV